MDARDKPGHDDEGGRKRRGRGTAIKIATFNVNDVNKRLPNLLAWLGRAKPDIVALQETKTTDAGFPGVALKRAGYRVIARGERTYNGVALLSRTEPHPTRDALPGDPKDTQSRYLEAAISGIDWIAEDPVPITATRLPVKSTGSCGHLPVKYTSPVNRSTPSMSGRFGSDRQPLAMT